MCKYIINANFEVDKKYVSIKLTRCKRLRSKCVPSVVIKSIVYFKIRFVKLPIIAGDESQTIVDKISPCNADDLLHENTFARGYRRRWITSKVARCLEATGRRYRWRTIIHVNMWETDRDKLIWALIASFKHWITPPLSAAYWLNVDFYRSPRPTLVDYLDLQGHVATALRY